LHNLQIQGPDNREIWKDVIWTHSDQASVEELESFRFSIGRISGKLGIPIIFLHTGYTGELDYEVFCHTKDGEAVGKADSPYNMKPIRLETLDMLRVKAVLIFAGYEFSDQTDPFEAGIPSTVAQSLRKMISSARQH
jgi:aminomethyltransferase